MNDKLVDSDNSIGSVTKSSFFKSNVPLELLYDFVNKISHKIPNTDHHLIDINSYKKSIYVDDFNKKSLLDHFCYSLLPYYHKEKQFFLTRKMSYNNLITILRQICRGSNIYFKSERKYDKSKTQIVHYIACQ